MKASTTHLVLIPSYNTGSRLRETVTEVLNQWCPVWLVIDGSNDGSERGLDQMSAADGGMRLIQRPTNGGKGAAVQTGAEAAREAGFSHVLVMDADGQHPAKEIPRFMATSMAYPDRLVLGQPVFGPEVPRERLYGRQLSVGLVRLETLGTRIGDPLFGFRVYPLAALLAALAQTRHARGFDFDPEVAVRMVWAGVPTQKLPAPCRYLTREQGGVSHFHYLRDNFKMIGLHTRLLLELVRRWPELRRRKDRP